MRSIALVACLFLVACTEVDDPLGGGDIDVTESVMASAGGTVEAGDVTLVIPPGSLATDTDITIQSSDPATSLPMYETIRGKVYDLGPVGTTFDPAATLTLPVPQNPGAGETAVVSGLFNGAWMDLPGTASTTEATAAVTDLTTFAVRFVADQS